jgi:hypothetical protein
MIDPRYLLGPALIVAGGVVLFTAFRLWMVNPLNRVFRLGPLVTLGGMEALLRLRLTLFAFGLMTVVSGIYRIAVWQFGQGLDAPVSQFLGSAETVLAIWAAYLASRAAVRLWLVG